MYSGCHTKSFATQMHDDAYRRNGNCFYGASTSSTTVYVYVKWYTWPRSATYVAPSQDASVRPKAMRWMERSARIAAEMHASPRSFVPSSYNPQENPALKSNQTRTYGPLKAQAPPLVWSADPPREERYSMPSLPQAKQDEERKNLQSSIIHYDKLVIYVVKRLSVW